MTPDDLERHQAHVDDYDRRGFMKDLSGFKRPRPLMNRPSLIPRDNPGSAIREAKRAHVKSSDQRDLLDTFGVWRQCVFQCEQQRESNILTVLKVAEHYHAVDRLDEYYELTALVCKEYGFYWPMDGAPPTEEERLRLADEHSRLLDILPDDLRYEGEPRPMVTKVAKAKREPEQVSLGEGRKVLKI